MCIRDSGDHRIAMSFLVAGFSAQGDTVLADAECINTSYPVSYTQLMCIRDRARASSFCPKLFRIMPLLQ